ncbi:MAG: hypothetical protein WCB09_11065 [Methylocella sp.]
MGESRRKRRGAEATGRMVREGCPNSFLASLTIFGPEQFLWLCVAEALGDRLSATIVDAAIQIQANARSARFGDGPLCLCCDHSFNSKAGTPVFFACLSAADAAIIESIIVSQLCGRCARLPMDEFNRRALLQLSKLGPTFRQLSPANMPEIVGNA